MERMDLSFRSITKVLENNCAHFLFHFLQYLDLASKFLTDYNPLILAFNSLNQIFVLSVPVPVLRNYIYIVYKLVMV